MIKPASVAFILILIAASGCIKETYDMNKLSDEIHYSPTFSVAAVTGSITLSDILKSGDTVRFDNDNFVSLVYKEDSVFNLKLKDYYDLDDLVSYSKGFAIGELAMEDFQGMVPVTLNTIRQAISDPALRSALLALDDGSPHNFPFLPETPIPEQSFTVFAHFQNVVFSSGTIEVSVKNNLQAPLNDIRIRLFNSDGHQQIGDEMIISATDQGETRSATMDLTGKTVKNSIVAAVIFGGSPGTTAPVIIDMDHSVEVGIHGYNLKVRSGKLKIPSQVINLADNNDTISFDPGDNIEIEKLRIKTGTISYHFISGGFISASFSITLPSSLRAGIPITEVISLNPGDDLTGTINVSNTELDLSTDSEQQFNRIPVSYSITASSNGQLIDFNKNDSIHVDLEIPDPDFDYLKGYFGQLTEQINTYTFKTGIDFLDHISGQLHISNPSVKLNYSNSFGIPVEITLDAIGVKNNQSVSLDLPAFTVAYPVSLSERTVYSSFIINKDNSKLPELISLPPAEVRFSGSAKMNPQGNTGLRNNYIFGNSIFSGSLEIEVPMAFRMNNLQFSDTLDNFLNPGEEEESQFSADNMETFILNIKAVNGFPLGASLKLILYDFTGRSVIKEIDATNIIKAAPVDVNGKASGITESLTSISFDKEFFEASKMADKIIFLFTMNTTGGEDSDVRIYSDYSLSFSASVKVKPSLKP